MTKLSLGDFAINQEVNNSQSDKALSLKDFKTKTVNSSMNLQKLVNRSMHIYLQENNLKENFETYNGLYVSGSKF